MNIKKEQEAKLIAEYEARKERAARNRGYTQRVSGLDNAGNFLYRRVYWDKVRQEWKEPEPWPEHVHPRRIKQETKRDSV